MDWRENLPSQGESDMDLPLSGVEVSRVDPRQVVVPAMTEAEVQAGETPAGKKLVPINPTTGVAPETFRSVIAAAYRLYMKNGVPPALEELEEACSDIVAPMVRRVFKSDNFKRAMLVRGINYGETRLLSPEQDMAIAVMGTPDGRPFHVKLKALGVAPSKWRAWLKQKTFREAWETYAGDILKDHENDMMVALVGQAVNGDVTAIKYAFEVSGRHNPMRQQNVDAMVLVTSIIEILQDELKDNPALLQKIGARMQLVGSTPSAQRVIEGAK